MPKKNKGKLKFSFGTDFQEQILKFIVTNQKGHKALTLLDDTYFTFIPHAIVCFALKKYFKKSKQIPDKPYLRESLRTMYETGYRQLANLLDEDKTQVEEIVNRIYEGFASDENLVLEKIINFAKFVRFREEIDEVDINNYEAYEAKIEKFNAIPKIGREFNQEYGVFLIDGMKDRAHRRHLDYISFPTPFWQLNRTMNAGGTGEGNVICVIAEEKRFKTGFLINTAKGYLRRKKKGVYFDLENGEMGLTIRNEQSYGNHTREEILSEKFDSKLLKLFRRYKRLGAELNIKRFPALSTTTDHMQAHLDLLRGDFGFVPDFAIVDYGLLMAAKSGKTDDFNRISDAFLDLKNFASFNKLGALWTVAHVVRDASKRRGTKYQPKDIAKCIDIPRHVDMLLSLQESDEEKEAGVMRLEVLEQRDGSDGKCLFWVDFTKQTMREFNRSEVREYNDQLGGGEEEDGEDKPKRIKITHI